MPFTLSHPAAVLPIGGFSRRFLSFQGLVVGSITPDIGYVFRENTDQLSHGFFGSIVFCLPIGLTLAGAWQLVGGQTIANRAGACREATATTLNVLILCTSVLIGVWTHLVWDSFTNNHGWAVERVAFLRKALLPAAGHEVKVCHALWYVSTFAGVAVLYAAYQKWAVKNYSNLPWFLQLRFPLTAA